LARGQPVVDIPPSAAVGPPQSGTGNGLNGEYFFAGHPTSPFATNANIVPNLAAAQQFMNSNPPTTRFQAGVFDYTGTDTSPVNVFLGNDGPTLSPPYTSPMYSSVYRFRGLVNVTSAQTLIGIPDMAIDFQTTSDDGSSLAIAGQNIVNNDGQHGNVTVSGIAHFTAAGLYPIEIVYFNDEYNNDTGGATLTIRSSIGTNDVTTLLTLPASSTFQSVPEPGTVLLCGLGVIGMAAIRRRKVV
jgi:hypothetical protein